MLGLQEELSATVPIPMAEFWDENESATVQSLGDLRVDVLDAQNLTPHFLKRWQSLCERSIHDNTFLAPEFLMPAWRCLSSSEALQVMTVTETRSDQLLLLGCFTRKSPSLSCPWPHLRALQTEHSYRTGLLVDQKRWAEPLAAWMRYLVKEQWSATVRFPRMRLDSVFARRLRSLIRQEGYDWLEQETCEVPAVFPHLRTEMDDDAQLSSSRRKTLRRNRTWLEQFGPLRLTCVSQIDELLPAIETFLRLERSGWKGQAQTALGCAEHASCFLKEMATEMFDSGKLLLSQLWAGDRVVASAINLLAGTTLFAFKIGWDAELAKGSPGTMHELALKNYLRQYHPEIQCLDSCAKSDSFLASLWTDRIRVGEGILSLSPMAGSITRKLQILRDYWHRFKKTSINGSGSIGG